MRDESTPQDRLDRLDMERPHSARVWNYFLGGKDNYAVDRVAGEAYKATFPQIIDIARTDRAFLGRAVRHLSGDVGIRQFLDIGTGLPTMSNTHEVAQGVAPESRIVYVDNDPLVLVHAEALLTSTPEGACDYLDADLREPGEILRQAKRTLDFNKPIAVMLLGILHFVEDYSQVRDIVKQLMDAMPSGSYLALTHATLDPSLGGEDVAAQNQEAQDEYNENADVPLTPRMHQRIAGFFDGLEVLEPGVVSMSQWRPEETPFGEPSAVLGYCGVGRKP